MMATHTEVMENFMPEHGANIPTLIPHMMIALTPRPTTVQVEEVVEQAEIQDMTPDMIQIQTLGPWEAAHSAWV